MTATILDIHGVRVEVQSEHADIHTWLQFDFRYFVSPAGAPAAITLDVTIGPIPYETIPPLVESMHGPQYVSFDDGDVRYVDYFGKALAIWDYRHESGRVHSTDPEFCYEKLYLLIQSRVGELLDRRGIHRIHALGVATEAGAALFLIPMRGGKSTLGLRLLKTPGVSLLSDDTPLVRADGSILPFPVRMGIMVGEVPADVPPQFVRLFQREQYGPKQLIDVTAFAGKICSEPQKASAIFCGKWTFADAPSMVPLSRFSGFRALARDCVVGLGLPQVVEFFLRTPLKDVIPKSVIVFRRVRAVLALLGKARVYEIRLCRNHERNVEFILRMIREGGAA